MRRYTEEELEDAKDFLRRRIDSELSMKHDVEELLGQYAILLLRLLDRAATQSRINALLDELIAQLLEDCYILGVDDNPLRHNAILLWMNSERGGDTLEGRVRKRVKTFFNEVFAVYAAYRLLGMDTGLEALAATIVANMKSPWENPVLVEVREAIASGAVGGDIEEFEAPHFGRGVEVSSAGALETITGFAVADAWMWWGHEEALSNGANGYYVVRGSSYPCEECNSHTGIFYPIDDENNRPQYHQNCCCMVVYTYKE
jgi:hypothetical protein